MEMEDDEGLKQRDAEQEALEEDGSRDGKEPRAGLEASQDASMEVDEEQETESGGESDIDNASEKSSSSSNLSGIDTDSECLSNTLKAISNQQKKLSYHERNNIHEDVHGVASNALEENPEMLQYSLSKLSSELQDLVLTDWKNNANASSLSAGYLLSRRSGFDANTYVNKTDFRLRFLRAENFDVRKAAIRLMKFMNLVLEIFGAFALCRPIKLTDFKRSEMKAIQTGWLQVLPFRDRSGRKLFIWTGQMGYQFDPILRIKITIYVLLAGTRDVESQQKGIVSTVFPGSFQEGLFSPLVKKRTNQMRYISYANRALEALPIKLCAVHYCMMQDPGRRLNLLERITLKMTLAMAETMLPRIKIHIADGAELRRLLSTYGIPVSFIPTTISGAVKKAEFKKWLKLQRRIDDLETAEERFSHVECPGSNDIVFRAGSSMIANPGNVKFRSVVELKVQEVLANSDRRLPQKTKEDIAMEIINEIVSQRPNARFLYWDIDNGCWTRFDNISQVKAKVAITFRDLKLKISRSRQGDAQI